MARLLLLCCCLLGAAAAVSAAGAGPAMPDVDAIVAGALRDAQVPDALDTDVRDLLNGVDDGVDDDVDLELLKAKAVAEAVAIEDEDAVPVCKGVRAACCKVPIKFVAIVEEVEVGAEAAPLLFKKKPAPKKEKAEIIVPLPAICRLAPAPAAEVVVKKKVACHKSALGCGTAAAKEAELFQRRLFLSSAEDFPPIVWADADGEPVCVCPLLEEEIVAEETMTRAGLAARRLDDGEAALLAAMPAEP